MAGNIGLDIERLSWRQRSWNRPKIVFIGSIGLLLMLTLWSMGTTSETNITLTKLKLPWRPNQQSDEASTEMSPVHLSGDFENADFPQGVGFEGNVALIMEEEPTAIHNFASVVTHFRSTLSPSWEMVILTRRGWSIPQSRTFRDYLASGAIKVRFLPEEYDHFPSHSSVSIFLTAPWLWEQFEKVNRLLMFQPDSILCANSNATVDDFLEWDFIGAPMEDTWIDSRRGDATHEPHPEAQGFNGGLCIRNPRLFLEVARRFDFKADLYFESDDGNIGPNFMRFEDHWFMRKLEENPELMAKANLPPPHIAGKFSVETWWWDEPLGFHQPHRWLPSRVDDIQWWCPEAGMIADMEMPDSRWGQR